MVQKVNAIKTIDTSDLVTKAEYSTKIENIERKVSIHDLLINKNLIS